jgi:hypothetical protein
MYEPYASPVWADNHQVVSNTINRGFRRIGRAARRLLGRVVPPDQSEEASKRTYCIG